MNLKEAVRLAVAGEGDIHSNESFGGGYVTVSVRLSLGSTMQISTQLTEKREVMLLIAQQTNESFLFKLTEQVRNLRRAAKYIKREQGKLRSLKRFTVSWGVLYSFLCWRIPTVHSGLFRVMSFLFAVYFGPRILGSENWYNKGRSFFWFYRVFGGNFMAAKKF